MVGRDYLSSRSRALLTDQMGLGKTIQAIAALPIDPSVIVVCPASLKRNWENEINLWRPDLSVSILSGRGTFDWPDKGEAVILNPECLTDNPSRPRAPGTILIADEAHYFKSPKAARTKKFRKLVGIILSDQGKVWGLTGTPLLRDPTDLWNVLKSLGGLEKTAFGTWDTLARCFSGRKTRFGWQWGSPSPTVPDRLKRVSLGRSREKVLPDLPKKSHRTHVVEPSPDAWLILNAIKSKIEQTGMSLDEAIADAIQTGRGPLFEEMSAAKAALAKSKTDSVIEIAQRFEESNEPLLVFSDHRAIPDLMGQRPGWGRITGSDPSEIRQNTVDRFQAGCMLGLACTIASGGIGLTLTRACHVLFSDQNWSIALNEQAEDRVCRIGQTKPVTITRLIANHPIDKAIHRALAKKAQWIKAVDKAKE